MRNRSAHSIETLSIAVHEILPHLNMTALNYQGRRLAQKKKSEVNKALQDPRVISLLEDRKLQAWENEIHYLKKP